MIRNFINTVEQIDSVPTLTIASFYDEGAVFIHPFGTSVGPMAAARQWKMSLKFCQGTQIKVDSVYQLRGGDYIMLWTHMFDRGRISGATHLTYSPINKKISHQTDWFDLDYFHTLFNND